jgi:hypothetical protein
MIFNSFLWDYDMKISLNLKGLHNKGFQHLKILDTMKHKSELSKKKQSYLCVLQTWNMKVILKLQKILFLLTKYTNLSKNLQKYFVLLCFHKEKKTVSRLIWKISKIKYKKALLNKYSSTSEFNQRDYAWTNLL